MESAFKFHCDSINIERVLQHKPNYFNLNFTVILLIFLLHLYILLAHQNLNSTVILLISWRHDSKYISGNI